MATTPSFDHVPIDPEVRSFFHAIKENPYDDTPRLIFADWLQERGNAVDAARGEFLRLNVLRHRLSPDDPTYDLLKRREGELFTEHRWTWLGPLVDAARSWTFERGMIQITAQAEELIAPEMWAWAQTGTSLWIDGLRISDIRWGHPQDIETRITSLAFLRLLAHLNRLDLSRNWDPIALRFAFRAARAHTFPFLKELCLSHNRLTASQISSLAQCRYFRQLALLDLRHNSLDDDAARMLAESPNLRNVAELRVGHNHVTSDGMLLLREAFGHRVHF